MDTLEIAELRRKAKALDMLETQLRTYAIGGIKIEEITDDNQVCLTKIIIYSSSPKIFVGKSIKEAILSNGIPLKL